MNICDYDVDDVFNAQRACITFNQGSIVTSLLVDKEDSSLVIATDDRLLEYRRSEYLSGGNEFFKGELEVHESYLATVQPELVRTLPGLDTRLARRGLDQIIFFNARTVLERGIPRLPPTEAIRLHTIRECGETIEAIDEFDFAYRSTFGILCEGYNLTDSLILNESLNPCVSRSALIPLWDVKVRLATVYEEVIQLLADDRKEVDSVREYLCSVEI